MHTVVAPYSTDSSRVTDLDTSFSPEELNLRSVRDSVVELRRRFDSVGLRKSILKLKEASREQGLPKPLLAGLLVEVRKRQLILDILEMEQ